MNDEKQIKEMAKDLQGKDYAVVIVQGKTTNISNQTKKYLTRLIDKGYRKIPEDSVVLTREDMKKYAEDCIAGQETGLDIINALIARAERYKEQAKQARKETAREILDFIETLKVKEDGRHQWRENYNDCIDRVILKLNQKFVNGVEVEE